MGFNPLESLDQHSAVTRNSTAGNDLSGTLMRCSNRRLFGSRQGVLDAEPVDRFALAAVLEINAAWVVERRSLT